MTVITSKFTSRQAGAASVRADARCPYCSTPVANVTTASTRAGRVCRCATCGQHWCPSGLDPVGAYRTWALRHDAMRPARWRSNVTPSLHGADAIGSWEGEGGAARGQIDDSGRETPILVPGGASTFDGTSCCIATSVTGYMDYVAMKSARASTGAAIPPASAPRALQARQPIRLARERAGPELDRDVAPASGRHR